MSVSDLGHITLYVPDVEACAMYAERVLGLHVTERVDDAVVMTPDYARNRVTYAPGAEPALGEIGLVAASSEALDEIEVRAGRFGSTYERGALGPYGVDAVRVTGPDGHPFVAYHEVTTGDDSWHPTAGIRNRRFGHVTMTAPDIFLTEQFLVDVFGFRVSDRIAPGIGTWLRCSSEHHVLAVLQGPTPGLHHLAFDVASLSDLGDLGDKLAGNGMSLIFGPGRHGPGQNLFTYHLDPAGNCVEVTAEMQRIFDEASWEIGAFPAVPETENVWGPLAPAGFDDYCTPLAATPWR